MSRSLIDRYTYGNSGWPAPFTPGAEIVYEMPRREREMINLARQQIEVQKNASRQMARSNIACAQIIAAEVAHQTQALESAISDAAETISTSVLSAADQICEAVDILGDRICAELSEIRWQLVQQNQTLEKMLDVLRRSRNNEAQQLVRQGVRHYVNKEYEEAEERFKRALEFDTTDYQVLMNLGYIEINKNNSSNALAYFKKALSLPDNLDSSSKSRTLWSIARLHYTEEDYEKAFSSSQEAFKVNSQDYAEDSFKLGVYAALAGKKDIALENISHAIATNSKYFAKIITEPDLEIIRQEVLGLLSTLSQKTLSKATEAIQRAEI